ncbi:NAD(P)H-binding protein [Rhodococcus triatomae]|uniref:Uncharacterized conserved protein YbjT, contains NAD(P)-binding and DUF2867 domains n=1 Tax=Rhodococcus triatomae TaxID=300028 RepID=A0A1G8EXM2_9NOCA|nr:NAD(P)H-binding protein [Rhodococcus triatomae]QNG19323.1 NAD(P)H-binding protein [Rhodococcus triatomae]QNG24764.1 NAD(P)H-binding protein [Rhodococcus triatomae]SDH74584.1 Uncharacterized conserved protein YbjT, contains NAD(P)-binding and DUF2867 domains [Rhodococcus triatomae]
MTRVLVAGGTGVAGRQVVAELLRREYEVRVLTRHGGAPFTEIEHALGDLVSGEGLPDALEGVDVVVDTTDGKTRKTRAVLGAGAENLLEAAAVQGVSRAILLSIVNVDRASFSYYQAKYAQEQIYARSPLDTVVVRATQFHDFVPMIVGPSSRVGILPAFRGIRFQTIDTRDVALALADAVSDDEDVPDGPVTIGGPEIRTARNLVEAWKRTTGSRGVVVPAPLPGTLGRFFRDGLNLVPENTYGTITFEEWARSDRR